MMLDMDEAFLSRRYYGGDLPAEAERALHAAALSYADDRAAEAFLARAAALAPGRWPSAIARSISGITNSTFTRRVQGAPARGDGLCRPHARPCRARTGVDPCRLVGGPPPARRFRRHGTG